MKLSSIKEGMLVVAKEQTSYNGLLGEIVKVKKEAKKWRYTVRFLKTDKMHLTHPQLNFKRIDNVLLNERQLYFFPETWLLDGYNDEGIRFSFDEVVCQHDTYRSRVEEQYLPY